MAMRPSGRCHPVGDVTQWEMSPNGRCHPMGDFTGCPGGPLLCHSRPMGQTDVDARRGLIQVLSRSSANPGSGKTRRPSATATAVGRRAGEQTDPESLIPVAVLGPVPVAIRRAAVPGRVVPGAAAYHPQDVPAFPHGPSAAAGFYRLLCERRHPASGQPPVLPVCGSHPR
jgi:hypothetical protein